MQRPALSAARQAVYGAHQRAAQVVEKPPTTVGQPHICARRVGPDETAASAISMSEVDDLFVRAGELKVCSALGALGVWERGDA